MKYVFSGYSQSRSVRPREKENDVLKRAVRDLFMIYQEESLKTRLAGVIRGEAGKSLNESEDHVTNEQGQIFSDGNFTGLADMSTFLLETNKQGEDDDDDDNKQKYLLLRIYSILRKTSQKPDVNESDDEQDIENHRGEADDDSLSAYSKPNHHITSMPLIGKFPSNPTNDSNINMSDYSAINESKLTALANETRTNVDWSYIHYPTDSTTKLNDDGELVLRNATPTTNVDVEFTNNMYPTDMTDGGDGGQEFFENKRNEQDIGYLPRTMSGEKKDELSDDKERNYDYDFRSEINFHYHSDVVLDKNNYEDDEVDVEDDDGGNDDGEGSNDDMDDDDKGGHIYVVDDYAADEDDVHDDGYDEEDAHYDDHDIEDDGDGNDGDDGDHGNDDDDHDDDHDDDSDYEYDHEYEKRNNEDTLLLATKPNDKEWMSTYHDSDNQGTYNHVIQTNTNEEGNDHHDNHGRTSIEDEDADRFLRWMLKYILRRMDDGSKSERNLDHVDDDQELLPSEDESSSTIRRYLAKSGQKERTVASISREGSVESRNDGVTLRKEEIPTEESHISLAEKDPGVLLQNIIKREDLERRNQIRNLLIRLRKRSEIARMKTP